MRRTVAALALTLLGAAALQHPAAAQGVAQGAAQAPAAGQPPLRCAVDGTYAPHAFPSLSGGVQGFNVDLFREVARRMGRTLTIDSASFSGLIPAMNAGRYDFLCAPVTVTRERAESVLFTEGYLWTELQFGTRRGVTISSVEDLRGKTIAVNKGTPYEQWVRANAEKLGLQLLAFDTQPDAVQATLSGRAYANLSGNTVVRYAASRTPTFVPSLVLSETRLHWAAPFPRGSTALRNQVEDVLECMKRDGTVARMSQQWFGDKPGPDQAENIVFPGYGVPDMPGYDPTPHAARCG